MELIIEPYNTVEFLYFERFDSKVFFSSVRNINLFIDGYITGDNNMSVYRKDKWGKQLWYKSRTMFYFCTFCKGRDTIVSSAMIDT